MCHVNRYASAIGKHVARYLLQLHCHYALHNIWQELSIVIGFFGRFSSLKIASVVVRGNRLFQTNLRGIGGMNGF